MAKFVDLLGTLRNTFRLGKATLDTSGLTALRTLTVQDKDGTLATRGDLLYVISFDYGDNTDPFSSSQSIIRHLAAETFTLPAGLTNSNIKSRVAATASTVLSINKNGSQVGTATIAAGGTSSTFSFATATTFIAATDEIEIKAPTTPDSTLAGLYGALKGTR